MEGILLYTYSSFSPFQSGLRGHILNCEFMRCAFVQSGRAFFFPSFASLTMWHAAQQQMRTRARSRYSGVLPCQTGHTLQDRDLFSSILKVRIAYSHGERALEESD